MGNLLEGTVAVVTGAAQGNGRAIAVGLAQHGADVAVGDLNTQGAEDTAQRIRETGRRACAARLDVADRESCRAFAETVHATLGAVGILVNNAGIIRRLPATDAAFPDAVEQTLAVNVGGSVAMVCALLPQLCETRGCIINLGSIASFVAPPGTAAYSTSKGAVQQLTKGLAVDLAEHGIRVNAIAPGVIATPMTAQTRANREAIRRFMEHTPMARVGEPEELVGPVVFLASPLASYITGATLPVDGGYLAV